MNSVYHLLLADTYSEFSEDTYSDVFNIFEKLFIKLTTLF